MDCCDRQVANLEALKKRSYVSLVLGFLLMLPVFENMVLHGISFLSGPFLFLMLTCFVWLDYAKQRRLFLQTIVGMGLVLLTPFYFKGLLLGGIMSVGALILVESLFFKRLPNFSELKSGNLKQVMKLPSSDDVVIFLAGMALFISGMHVLLPNLAVGHFMLHEAFIAIGAVNLSFYHQQRLQNGLMDHNFTAFYNMASKRGNVLKSGSLFKFTEQVQVPVALKATQSCEIVTDESTSLIQQGDIIPKGAWVKSGEATLLADLSPAHHPGINRKGGMNVRILFGAFFLLAVLVSVIKGALGASVLIGIEHFIANAAVLCPCVFLISGPLLYQSLQKWAHSAGIHPAPQMPQGSRIDIVVFDRTNTLYHEVQNEDVYQLHKKAEGLMQRLKDAGKKIYILSGHHDGDLAANNLTKCKRELKDWVDPENIIFDAKFHQTNDLNGKAKWIEKMQKAGQRVCMIGDGENDAQALYQADIGIAVHKDSCLPDVLENANFSGHIDHVMEHGASLIESSERVNQAVWWFNFVACAYHFFMLTLVNGGYLMLFSAGFPETLGVIAMSLFCLAAQLAVRFVGHNIMETNRHALPVPATSHSQESYCEEAFCPCPHHHHNKGNQIDKSFCCEIH